jgi:uncharacterized protein YjbI with pentapeptide repeats
MAEPEHLRILKMGMQHWNQWRDSNADIKPDLSHAQLDHADLSGLDLSHGNLNSAKMINVDLSGAELSHADLRGADLRRALLRKGLGMPFTEDLSGDPRGLMSNLVQEIGTDGIWRILNRGDSDSRVALPDPFVVQCMMPISSRFYNARFDGADLRRAIIVGSDLQGVSLSKATFGGTILDCDLSQVTGLDDCNHSSPSVLSPLALRTLPRPAPISFLRGFGLSDWEISIVSLYDQTLTNEQLVGILYKVNELRASAPLQYYSVFISYSHADEGFANRLYSHLQDRGIRCWYDKHSMLPGDDASRSRRQTMGQNVALLFKELADKLVGG